MGPTTDQMLQNKSKLEDRPLELTQLEQQNEKKKL